MTLDWPWRHAGTALAVTMVCAALALLDGLAVAWLQWWQPTADHASASLQMVLLGALWCGVGRQRHKAAARELLPWALNDPACGRSAVV